MLNGGKFEPMSILIFDFDGVIVDSLSVYRHACQHAMAQQNEYRQLSDNPFATLSPVTFAALAKQLQLNVTQFVDDVATYMHTHALKLPFFAGIKPTLNELAKKHTLCVVSAGHSELIHQQLRYQDMSHCFSQVLGGNHTGDKTQKMVQLHTQYDLNSIVIGDTKSDIQAAQQANLPSIAVTWGWHSQQQLIATNPTVIIHSPCEITQAITSITGEEV